MSRCGSGDPFLDEVTGHLIAAGGKRLRPGLALAAATGGPPGRQADDLQGAVAVELVHLASLYHDDVMDEATMRRTVESVNARWGNLVAIVAGDFLLARSAEIAASLGTEIAGLLANTLGQLCQGQVAEVRAAFSTERTEDHYFTAIAGKTAALMATVVPDRGPHRRSPSARGRGPHHLRSLLRDAVPAPRRRSRRHRHRREPGQTAGPGSGRRHLHLARPEGPATTRAPGPSWRRCWASRSTNRSGTRPGRSWPAPRPSTATVAAGRRYVEEASEAAASLPGTDLGRSLTDLARGLLDDLPVISR